MADKRTLIGPAAFWSVGGDMPVHARISVRAVLLLSAANRGGDRDLLVAALAGLGVALGATALLAWLLRRR